MAKSIQNYGRYLQQQNDLNHEEWLKDDTISGKLGKWDKSIVQAKKGLKQIDRINKTPIKLCACVPCIPAPMYVRFT